jgi:hypothetical protein
LGARRSRTEFQQGRSTPPTRKEIHKDQSDLIPLDADTFIATATDLLKSDRYTTLGMALMALTGRRPAEICFSAKFSLPEKKLSFPALIFEDQLKTRQAPGTSFAPYTTYPRPGRAKACSGRF